MTLNIALIGYGKMGKEIEKIALQRNHEILAVIDSAEDWIEQDEQLAKCNVAIEFSQPDAAYDNVLKCFRRNLPVVCGTTGWAENHAVVKKMCREENKTLFFASNFSIGVNIFFEINRFLAHRMNFHPNYDVTIEEAHHVHKADSPSGTAIRLAEDIIHGFDRKDSWISQEAGEETELQIKSIRESEIVGTHIVRYTSEEDEIEIRHIAKNRRGFALGALTAAEWLVGKTGYFEMKDLLNT